MPVSHNTSCGIPMYHYSIQSIKENKDAAVREGNSKLSRCQRRKLERKLRKNTGKNIKLEVD